MPALPSTTQRLHRSSRSHNPIQVAAKTYCNPDSWDCVHPDVCQETELQLILQGFVSYAATHFVTCFWKSMCGAHRENKQKQPQHKYKKTICMAGMLHIFAHGMTAVAFLPGSAISKHRCLHNFRLAMDWQRMCLFVVVGYRWRWLHLAEWIPKIW